MIPAASQKLIEPLVVLTLHGEKAMFLEVKKPLVIKYTLTIYCNKKWLHKYNLILVAK